jgi:hypothetical protein
MCIQICYKLLNSHYFVQKSLLFNFSLASLFSKLKVGLWDLPFCLCVCMFILPYELLNSVPIFMKLGMYIMTPRPSQRHTSSIPPVSNPNIETSHSNCRSNNLNITWMPQPIVINLGTYIMGRDHLNGIIYHFLPSMTPTLQPLELLR